MAALHALLALTSVWTLLLAGAWLGNAGHRWGVAASFAAACLLLLATRESRPCPAPATPVCLLGIAAGVGSFAGWIAVIAWLGLSIGLDPVPSATLSTDPFVLVGALLLAPVFEELLYRERLHDALASIGMPGRVAICSALFALTHVGSWAMLGTFLVGISLSATRELGGSIALCIGLHAGLNLAGVVGPELLAGPAPLLAGVAAYLAAMALCRRAPAVEGELCHVG